MGQTTARARWIMAATAGVVGVFMITAAPWIVQTSLERVLGALIEVSKERPQFESGITIFNFFYPLWRAVGFVAGVSLLVLAVPMGRAEAWTYPTALVAAAVPAISGMFMFLPYISWVGGFPLPMAISWVGLLGFWVMLLIPGSSWAERGVKFAVFTFLGMLATHSFVLGIGSQRMLATRPLHPLYAGLEWWILTLVGEVNWIGTILLVLSIPFLAMKKRAGWWMTLTASLAVLLVDASTQIVRTKTLDYLYGALLAAGLLLLLLLPRFKKRLVDSGKEGTLEV